MKLTKCENGHFYDSDKYPECPYCNTDLLRDRSIVRTGEAEQPAAVETAAPAGPVTGWLVVLDGPAKGRDLRLGVGRSFLGLDADGTPVTLSADAPLSTRRAVLVYDEEKSAFTLLPGSSQELCYLGGDAVLTPQPLTGGETLRMGDAMETMLEGLQKVMHGEPREEKELRRLADDINVLYTAIKLYLARMPQDELAEEESRRWAEIIEMSLNLEQASDIVERMGSEIADKSLAARRAFSGEGLKELEALHEQLVSNLKLAMLVFFSSDVPSARRLRRNKHRFRILNRRYSHAHVERLHQQNVQSIETSSLHLGLLGDMKRLNSLFCAVAYSVMEQPDEDDERDDY